MQLAFDSLSGNVRRFVQSVQQKYSFEAFDLKRGIPDGEFLLLTYTFGTGQVPDSTARFLEHRAHELIGVVSSGSFHWGTNFARAGDLISARYGVPCVARINKAGTTADRDTVVAWLQAFQTHGGLSLHQREVYGTLD